MTTSVLGRRSGPCCASVFACLALAAPGDSQMFTEQGVLFAGFESWNGSAAVVDVSNDSRPDLLLSGWWPLGNDMVVLHNEDGRRFVAEAAGMGEEIGGLGRIAGPIGGDYDNDGDLDLFVPVAARGAVVEQPNLLLRNDRGVFGDVAQRAGLTDTLLTSNAVWFDYDRDGNLDLFTLNHSSDLPGAEGPQESALAEAILAQLPDLAGLAEFDNPDARCKLYRNSGYGAFTDVTESVGLDLEMGPIPTGVVAGAIAADLNNDGWQDLYVGRMGMPNKLFLCDGGGAFLDATSGEVADPGLVAGVAVGDIDNDGDLDLFQAAPTAVAEDFVMFRSLLLLNLGDGEFIDMTEGTGLSEFTQGESVDTPTFADVDNDGDLDLVYVQVRATPGTYYFSIPVFQNDGQGSFEVSFDQALHESIGYFLAVDDVDGDGFLDVVKGPYYTASSDAEWTLYRNLGNDNHWLRVELVGQESNRSGIGARIVATSGGLQQTREIPGNHGGNQVTMGAHFGLGSHDLVDQLEVRWPSGRIDYLTDVPVDQSIRVLEGGNGYHAVRPTSWERADSLVAGESAVVGLAMRPALFEPEAVVVEVAGDLSQMGGAADVPFAEAGDGIYELVSTVGPVANGLHQVAVMIEQTTSHGPHWARVTKQIVALPETDQVVWDEALAEGWQLVSRRVEDADLAQTDVTYRGETAAALQVEESFAGWLVAFESVAPVDLFGYETLRFAFRPGDVALTAGTRLTLQLRPGKGVNLLEEQALEVEGQEWHVPALDLERREWQVVEIPLPVLEVRGPLEAISLSGNFGGTFYLDDIRLVATRPAQQPGTAVIEEQSASIPSALILDQNYPNPFNSSTTIRLNLPRTEIVELTVHNLAGQQVCTLASGQREAGTYTFGWDGRDEGRRALASGVYLCRLQAGGEVEARKLVLVR